MSKVNLSSVESLSSAQKVNRSLETALDNFSNRESNERSDSFVHILAAPYHYESSYSYPLIVWLHDAGQTELELFDVVPKISAQNYVSVAPRGVETLSKRIVRSHVNGQLVDESSWTEVVNDWVESEEGIANAERLVFHSIKEALRKFNVNSKRIFLLGRGTGATMALRLGLRNPTEFAGVASIDGTFPSLDNMLLRNWKLVRDLPVLMITGTSNVKLSAQQLRFMHTSGMTVTIRQYNEKPGMADPAQTRMKRILTDVNRWLIDREQNPQTPISDIFAQ